MKTDDLVRALAVDAEHSRAQFGPAGLLALAAAVAATLVFFIPLFGLRQDFYAAIATPRFVLKIAVVALIAVAAAGLFLRAGRPGAKFGSWLLFAGVPVLLLLTGVAAELVALPSNEWAASLKGTNRFLCLTVIPALSLLPLAAALAALRYGAPTQPTLAGAIAGLAAGGIAATFYALNCNNDSPLFVAAWYPIAIGIVVLAGATIGSRLLRW